MAQAMDYRMINKSSLAEQLRVNPSTITKYLNGDARPKPDNFVAIYQILGFPPAFFTTPVVAESDDRKLWRSFASAKKVARLRGEVALDWQVEVHNYFNSVFTLPKFNLEEFQVKTRDHKSIPYDQIDNIALQIREHWGVGTRPLTKLLWHMECSGIVVNAVNLMVEKLDAVSAITDGVPHVLLNSFETASARSRFDAAHELGHIILHSKVGKEGLKKEGFSELEDQAHYFASSLLLPAESFLRDLWAPTMKCFIEMKPKWITSVQAMMRRALDLNAITHSQYSYLNIHISKKHWRKVEPLDDTLKVERPRLFAQCLERLENDKGISPKEMLDTLRMPVDVAEQFFAVRQGYFDEFPGGESTNVLSFRKG